jgi:hypothetical protein
MNIIIFLASVVWHVEWTGVYRVWVRKPETKRPLDVLYLY